MNSKKGAMAVGRRVTVSSRRNLGVWMLRSWEVERYGGLRRSQRPTPAIYVADGVLNSQICASCHKASVNWYSCQYLRDGKAKECLVLA